MKYATFPKLTIATVIGLSKTELGNAVLRIWSGKIWPMPKTRCSFFHKFGHLLFISIQIIFIEIFLLKSDPVQLVFYIDLLINMTVLLRTHIQQHWCHWTQECYLFGDINRNLQPNLRIKKFLETNSQMP